MSSPVERQFASLSECFLATINTADEGLLVCMGVLVLFQVLGQSESLRTEGAFESLDLGVNVVVPLERELGCEHLAAALELTYEHLFFLHVIL
jgi:hypothetical protein